MSAEPAGLAESPNLEPLRAALRAETDAEIGAHLEAVAAECARLLAEAEAEAHRLVRQGRHDGERAAAKEAIRRRATAMRRAREIRLQARQRQIEELRRRAREAVLRVRDDDGYPALLERLAVEVRRQLGPAATVEPDPDGLGGVIGRHGPRSVDYSLPALVERVIEDLDTDLERLWR
jgi:vacuolar-type H+-ATPase subunit E/Vma4